MADGSTGTHELLGLAGAFGFGSLKFGAPHKPAMGDFGYGILARLPSNPLIMRVPFFLLPSWGLGFNKCLGFRAQGGSNRKI